MNRRPLVLAGAALAVAALAFGAGRLHAQGAGRPAGRARLVRKPPTFQEPVMSAQALSAKVGQIQARAVLTGTLLLFQYNPDLTRELDLDDNGDAQDNGDRLIAQGKLWLSNRSGAKLRVVGEFASVYDYLDASGEATGTDVLQQTDLLLYGSGQVRAGGFWNVEDVVGSPAVGVLGATGSRSLRIYGSGQLVFLGKVADGEELYFLTK
jgi:hypothetical protein